MIVEEDIKALRIAFDELERRWEFNPQDSEFISALHDLGDAIESIETQFSKKGEING